MFCDNILHIEKLMKIFLLAFAFCLMFPFSAFTEHVKYVVDGDTIRLITGEKVRFYGVDSQEINTEAGKQAKIFLESILPQNASIKLIRIGKDRYKRTLAIVLYQNQVLQEIMVSANHAKVLWKYCKLEICKEW